MLTNMNIKGSNYDLSSFFNKVFFFFILLYFFFSALK